MNKLLVLERKILRQIIRPFKDNGGITEHYTVNVWGKAYFSDHRKKKRGLRTDGEFKTHTTVRAQEQDSIKNKKFGKAMNERGNRS